MISCLNWHLFLCELVSIERGDKFRVYLASGVCHPSISKHTANIEFHIIMTIESIGLEISQGEV